MLLFSDCGLLFVTDRNQQINKLCYVVDNKVERQLSKKNLYASICSLKSLELCFLLHICLQFEMRQVSQLNVLCVSLLESGRPYMVNYNAFCIKTLQIKLLDNVTVTD